MSERPSTSGRVELDLRLPLTDRGPVAHRARQAKLGGMGGYGHSSRYTDASSPRSGGLHHEIGRDGPSPAWASGTWSGHEGHRIPIGGPPGRADAAQTKDLFYGHEPIEGPPAEPLDLAASLDHDGSWANLTRDYDEEFPTDPAGWHFGNAFQDLQAIQHKHMLAAPAAGPGFFYSTARTSLTPSAANPSAFAEDVRPSTAPYVMEESSRPTTAPVEAPTAPAASRIANTPAREAHPPQGGATVWALDELDSSHHFIYEGDTKQPGVTASASKPRTPSPPERQPSPPDDDVVAAVASGRLARPTSVRVLTRPPQKPPVAPAPGSTAGMSVATMERRLKAGGAPALHRRVVMP